MSLIEILTVSWRSGRKPAISLRYACIWKVAGSRIAKTKMTEKNNVEKKHSLILCCYIAIVIKVLLYWWRDRYKDQWNRIQVIGRDPYKYSQLTFLKDFIYLFSEGKRGRKREQNVNGWLFLKLPWLGTWLTTQACALTGSWTSDPFIQRLVLNPLSHTSQGPTDFWQIWNTSLVWDRASGHTWGKPYIIEKIIQNESLIQM